MLRGDNELLGDLPGGGGEALSPVWVSLDALHQHGWTLEMGRCCSVLLRSGVTQHLAVVLLFGHFGRRVSGAAATWGDRGCPGISLGRGVGR